MDLPVMPPVRPMLAKAVHEVPTGPGFVYEPKWDGFRCVAFRDGDEVELGSRNDKPFTRYFPDVVAAMREALPERCVLDGEMVVVWDGALDFGRLGGRIHPAASRVRRLAGEWPATFVAFDVLALGDEDLRTTPFAERRRVLEGVLGGARQHPQVRLTPATTDPARAEDWFRRFAGAGFDGVIAKPAGEPYVEGRRTQLKVKHVETADCVVAGYRLHKDGEGVGSLLMALVGEDGGFVHVGAVAAFAKARRTELLGEVAPWEPGAEDGPPWATAGRGGAGGEAGGAVAGGEGAAAGPTRWDELRALGWRPLRPERVAEVRYDPVVERWFRSPARFVRWRDDKAPGDCGVDQLDVAPPAELAEVFAGPADGGRVTAATRPR
jgi:ATP-dependent DNA ligase